MTDERDPREQDTAPTDGAPAADLPTAAEDRSATADLAAAGGDRAREGDGTEDDGAEEGRASSGESQAAGEATETGEVTETRAASAEEPPTGDTASPSEDAPGASDDAVAAVATPPEPPDVSADTSSPAAENAASEAPAETEAEPAESASPHSPESAASTAPETAAETPATATEEPAAEKPPAEQDEASAGPAPAEPEAPEDPAVAELRRAKEEGTTVEGKVIGWNRGGFHVVVGEVTAFCPSSEMEIGRPRNPQSYVDRSLSFRVVKLQKKGRRVVLSRAAVLGEERQRVVSELAPGAVVRGRVTSLPDFGAFVDLGGVEGLVHVSEISRGRVKNPKDALEVGQEVEVKVLKVEQDGERISLSMKDLEPDPWQGVAERYPRGEKFSGKVARRADFGLFVELEPEVEGLVHVSQLPPGTELGDPSLDPGREIEVWVREVDRKRQRISLSLREIPSEDPWKEATKRFPEGDMVEGTVESIAPFGVFVNLAPGLTGLLPGSQTGLPKGTSAARAFTPGQKVRVQVLAIDTRRKRISLGREGSRVEATRGDLQEFKKQQREREQEAPTAMAAAFARLREDREGSEQS